MRMTDACAASDVADLLMYVNARLWIGHFDLWPEDGTIVFRHAMIFPDARASASQCEALLNLALEACEHYYPAFQFVLWGGKTAEEAVAAAVLECAGRREAGSAADPSRSAPAAWAGVARSGWIATTASARSSPSSRSPSHSISKKLREETSRRARSRDVDSIDAHARSRACVVALKPQILKSEAAAAARHRRIRRADDLHRRRHHHDDRCARHGAPKARIVRAMPNTPGAIGRGITALYARRRRTPQGPQARRTAAVRARRNAVGEEAKRRSTR